MLLVCAFIAAAQLSRLTREAGDRVEHTFEVMSQIGELDTYMERSETAARGYLLDPDPVRITNFKIAKERLESSVISLRSLVFDNPEQLAALNAVYPDIKQELFELDTVVTQASDGDLAGAREQFTRTARLYRVTDIRKQTDAMRAAERRLLGERRATETRTVRLLGLGLAATGILLLMLGAAAAFIVRRYVVDLRSTGAQLQRLNTNLEGAVQERTADLVRANEEVQRFAYIVSHDLRSPLVNIMGFTAELESANKAIGSMVERIDASHPDMVGEDARFAAKEDLPEAIGFIRSATQKMDRLINAILALSRQGRRVLTPEMLPMDAVIADIAGNLATLADSRSASVQIEKPLPDVVHDRLAIEQVFQNLIENAIKYLVPGRPGTVIVRGRKERDRAIFEVEDNGRGIAAGDHRRVFELFRRSGTQDQPGEGIGLANVNALVLRLGGYIDLKSELGQGSTFTVNLPVEYRERGEQQ